MDAERLLASCEVTRVARGGPGGQHANKTATGVRILHRPTGLRAECCEHREGARNRRVALERLRLALACALRGAADPAWLAPHLRAGRLVCGPQAPSWPAVVAVLLDALHRCGGSLRDAAAAVRLSTSQLAGALVADRQVRAAADAIRAAHGLSALRA